MFFDAIYEKARVSRSQFGHVLLEEHANGYDFAPTTSGKKAVELVGKVTGWLDAKQKELEETTEISWGKWMLGQPDDQLAQPTGELEELLLALDELMEPDQELGRYLSQISPLGKDRALAEEKGVRIMSMGGAKGLTVRATIVGALEQGIIPRPDADLAEERRLLYVAMTRAKEFLFGTWAGRRLGPTARSGQPKVGTYRRPSSFLEGGPISSQSGPAFLKKRWP